MPKIKVPKSSPSIDMTPMVDLAFLLVTFFMLTAQTREPELVQIDTPFSIEDKELPLNYIIISIDKNGRKFITIKNQKLKEAVMKEMIKKYKTNIGKKEFDEFLKIPSVGCEFKNIQGFLASKEKEREKYIGIGIPTDSIKGNELKDWINFSNIHGLEVGNELYNDAMTKKPDVEVGEFKPKFILKADNNAVYYHAKDVIETFRDLEITNLNFVTSLRMVSKDDLGKK